VIEACFFTELQTPISHQPLAISRDPEWFIPEPNSAFENNAKSGYAHKILLRIIISHVGLPPMFYLYHKKNNFLLNFAIIYDVCAEQD
jgi:hypothetical protein